MSTTLSNAIVNLGAPLSDVDEGQILPIAGDCRGFVVVTGHLAGRTRVFGGTGVELLGAGDVVLVDAQDRGDDPRVEWTALDGVQVAWVQDRSWAAMLRHPAWSKALIESQGARVEHLRAMQAASTLTRVDDRILGAMWLLAERFGNVTPDGTAVGIPLAHRLLGELIGARRPTVTTAISKLTAEGHLSRCRRGRWLLHGEAPRTGDGAGSELASLAG